MKPRRERSRAYAVKAPRTKKAFSHLKSFMIGRHPVPSRFLKVASSNPMKEKKQMPNPARKVMKPDPGAARVPRP